MNKNNLMLIKTSLNELVLSEIVNTEDHTGYVLIHPFVLHITNTSTSAEPFLNGSNQNHFMIPKDYIITMGVPDEFISKFYGSMVFRSCVHDLLEREPFTGKSQEEFDDYVESKLIVQKAEIIEKFGMMDDEDDSAPQNKVIH